jgi:hypothetical protein
MEAIMNFLEAYWGYSLIGGVTIGTVVSGIYLNLKSLGVIKAGDTKTGKIVEQFEDKLNIITEKYSQSEEDKQALILENDYLKKVIATTFKAVSYITLASKLPPDDKLALEADFTRLGDEAKATSLAVAKLTGTQFLDAAKTITKQNTESVLDIVATAVTQGKSILDKYTAKGDV